MNNYIDTREGWKELDVVEPNSTYQLAEYDPRDGSVVRAWVREEPRLPLPTEPYTVIRVAYQAGMTRDGALTDVLTLTDAWYDEAGNGWESDGIGLWAAITGFEVLSEPRSVTAKAVLGRLLNRLEAEGIKVTNIVEWIDMTGREFGVYA